MQILARDVADSLGRSSLIRKMFETANQLYAKYGKDKVCDFSLGNPDVPSPPSVVAALREVADLADQPAALGYMTNAGFPWARANLARHLSAEQNISLTEDDVLLTGGAAGAINSVLRAILEPGDEVLAFVPYFVDYGFYTENFKGRFLTVPTQEGSFAPDIEALERAISPSTRALIMNSPNNPTGLVYSEEQVRAIIRVLEKAGKANGRPVYLISDEPYRFLTYDGVSVPPVLPLYKHAIIVSSFSKSLGLAGERVGYVALSPLFEERNQLMAGILLAHRALGFINAPVVGQYLMDRGLGSGVDVSIYARRRKLMADILTSAGYEFNMPQGGFYFFVEAPGGDDMAFIDRLAGELVLGVPGTGFGCPGWFRLAYCVDEAVIARSAEAFSRAFKKR